MGDSCNASTSSNIGAPEDDVGTGDSNSLQSRRRPSGRPARGTKTKRLRRNTEAKEHGHERSAAPEPSADALYNWLTKNGAEIDGVRIEAGGGAGRRLVATKALPSGFVFVRLPAQCALTTDACLASVHGQAIRKRHALVKSPEASEDESLENQIANVEPITHRSVLYAFLMAASDGDDCAFGPFLRYLRGGTLDGSPHNWCETDRARLPLDVCADLQQYDAHIMGEYHALFPSLSKESADLFPMDACTERCWRQAHGMYMSNAFPGASEHDDGILLPLLSCMNHDSEAANVEWLGLGLDSSAGARVTRPILEGEELLYSYGCKGNSALVVTYGFAIWDNPHEIIKLRFELASPNALPEDSCEKKVWFDAATRLEKAAEAGGAETHGLGAASFAISLDDLDEAIPAEVIEASAACCAAQPNTNSSWTSFLRTMLIDAGKALMRKTDIENKASMHAGAWERYERNTRRRDGIRVGSHLCAGSPEGCAVAIRSSRLHVLMAALDLLEEENCESDECAKEDAVAELPSHDAEQTV